MRATALLLPLLGLANGQALVFPEPRGPYVASLQTEELIDARRLDPWNEGSIEKRRIMISRFRPVARAQCTQTCRVPYMPPVLAGLEDEIIGAYIARNTSNPPWPKGILSRLELQLCCAQLPATDPGSYPRLLLDPGLNTTRLLYSAMAQHLASIGWDVTVLDHPYETDIVQFPDGTVVTGGRVVGDLNNIPPLLKALDVRAADASLVLDHLDVKERSRAGFVGQSFGGAAAGTTMLNDTRVRAGVNLDGYMFGPVLDAGVGRPGVNQSFLLWGSEGHNSATDPSWGRFRQTMERKRPEEWFGELNLKGGMHGTFTDFSIITDVAGLRSDPALVYALGAGSMSSDRAMDILKAYLDDYFKMTLLGKRSCLLNGPSREFPEVEFT